MAKKSSTASKKTVQKKPTVKKKPGKAPAKKKVVAKAAKPSKVVKKKAAVKPVKKASAKEPKKLKAIAPTKPAAGKAAKKVEVKAKAAPMPKPDKAPKKEKAPKVAKPIEVEEELVEEEDEGPEEIVLTDAEGRRYCRVKDCDQLSVVDAYCRYHYLLFWKRIQVRKKILTEGKLERYIEELTSRYPDKFLDMLRKDLRSEKEFVAVIQELEIDESASESEFEDEAQNYIDEVRGMGEATSDRQEEDF